MQERWRSWSVVWAYTCSSGKFPCAVCHPGVGSTSIFYNRCKHWVHKNAMGSRTWQRILIIDVQGGRSPQREVQVRPDKLEVVASFCSQHALKSCWLWTFNHNTYENHLDDIQGAATSSLFPSLSFKTHGHLYSSCVGSAMLHTSETWPSTMPNLQLLQRKDRAMIRKICNVKPQDIVTIRSNELLAWHGIEDLDLILKERRLCWYGYVECSNGAVKTAFDI